MQIIKRIFYASLMIILFYGWLEFHIAYYQNHQLPQLLDNQRCLIQGKVLDLPEQYSTYQSFLFRVEKFPEQPNLNISNMILQIYLNDPNLKINQGETWNFLAHLKRNHPYKNPGGFDRTYTYMEQNIDGQASIIDSSMNQKISGPRFFNFLQNIRLKINDQIEAVAAHDSLKGFLKAILIGVRNDITPDQWQVFSETGTNHLIAIAGLHIGFLTTFIYFVSYFSVRYFEFILKIMPAQKLAMILAYFIALLYSAVSGLLIPSQRAILMLSGYTGLYLLMRKVSVWRIYFLVLVLVLIFEPLAIFSESFWMSFWAIFIILYAFYFHQPLGHLRQFVYLQYVLSISMIPICLYLFDQASLISCLANFIVVPWVGLAILPCSFTGILLALCHIKIGSSLLLLALWQIHGVWYVLSFLAAQHGAVYHAAYPHVWPILLANLGIVILFLPRGFPMRWCGIFLFLPLFFYPYPKLLPGEIKFTVLSVGQGLSAVVQTQHHQLVFDAGPKYDLFDAGDAIVKPFLWVNGLNHIDMLVISHGDLDHRGGAQALLNTFPVQTILTSVPNLFVPDPQTQACQAGQHWQWDQVQFEVIYPQQDFDLRDNNRSCVIRVCTGANCILLTGDIELPAEQRIVARTPLIRLHAQILVAPHHGSGTSSSEAFIQAVQPQDVIFPVGYDNRFNFPDPQVMIRYQQMGAILFRTDQEAVEFKVDPSRIEKIK